MPDITDIAVNVIQKIRAVIEDAATVLVVSHVDPDGDALGTQLAFGRYLKASGKSVYMTRDSEIPDKYQTLPGVDNIVLSDSLPHDLKFDTAVVLECPTLERVGNSARFLTDDVRIVNIDHHHDGTDLGEINWIDRSSSSVGEMVYEYLAQIGFKLSPEMAHCLYVAIMTDTGRFRFASTSPRTCEVAGRLIAEGADPRKACDDVYYSMHPSSLKLVGKVLNGIEYHHDGRICLLSLTQAMLDEAGAERSESEGLVDYAMFARGVEIGALLKENDNKMTRVSLRSRDGFDVAAVAARYGGGGHINAAGCEIGLPLEEARKEILAVLGELIGNVD